ncbi:transgelin [Pancytospora philotis]|nr:transgelin [Pancytospora philotis]
MQAQNEGEVKGWIEEVLCLKMNDDALYEQLRDGVILCVLINKITGQPSKFPNVSKMSFVQMENICFFIESARKLGVPDSDNFQTIDLFEGSGMKQVICCLYSLSRHLHKSGRTDLPVIGPKLIEPVKVSFTRAQLDDAKRVMRLEYGYAPEIIDYDHERK